MTPALYLSRTAVADAEVELREHLTGCTVCPSCGQLSPCDLARSAQARLLAYSALLDRPGVEPQRHFVRCPDATAPLLTPATRAALAALDAPTPGSASTVDHRLPRQTRRST